MLKIGLTGGIGSGKTMVSDLFHKQGIAIIDTDMIARSLVDDSSTVRTEIARMFDQTVLRTDGTLDRKALANIVFNDAAKKAQLENLLHPKIRREVQSQIDQLEKVTTPPAYIIVVIPLLLETDFTEIIDHSLAVIADEATRVNRVAQRDGRKVDEIRSIIDVQTDDRQYIEKCDDVIENNNNFKQLETLVGELHQRYLTLARNFA